MLRKVVKLASLACLATLCLLYPLVETLDGLDSPVPAADLEIELIVLLTFIGIAFLFAHLLASVAVSAVMGLFSSLVGRLSSAIQINDFAFRPFQSPSPPLPLRI